MPVRYAALLAALLPAAALGQAPAFLPNPSPAAHESYGYAVDVDGDVAVVGVPDELTDGSYTGAAYVYRMQPDGAWALEARLQPADYNPSTVVLFGHAVAVSGDVVVVAAPEERHFFPQGGDAITRGSAYVFRRGDDGTWALEAEFSQAAFGDAIYGLDVDVQGDTLVVGVKDRFVGPPGQGGGGRPGGDICHPGDPYELGRAEVFRYDGAAWAVTDSLVAPDSLIGSGYGVSVSLDGDAVAVGAPLWYTAVLCGDAADADEIGRAYVWREAGGAWTLEATLAPADLEAEDQFGYDVALSEGRLVAGAPYRDGVSTRSGAAFSFARTGTTWAQEAEFVGQNTDDGDYFGFAVDLQGPYAIVGAPRYRNGDLSLGATYGFRYENGAWQQGLLVTYDVDLSPQNPIPINFGFGSAVALDMGHVLIGAPEYGDYDGPSVAVNVGAAFSYTTAQYFQLVVTGGPETPGGTPALALGAVTPNPAPRAATATLTLDAATDVRVALYDALGREVAVVQEGPLPAGPHALPLDTAALPAGVYVLRAASREATASIRLTVAR